MPGLKVSPVIFVRHPLDRIRSAYEFERRQKAETPGAKLAKETDLAGYIGQKLARGDRQCRGFQTYRFSTFERQGPARRAVDPKADRALALEAAARLPFIGVVEDFAGSMADLENYLRQDFPDFRAFGAKENVWREDQTLGDRLARMRSDLGETLWMQLVEANQEDMELYQLALKRRGLTLDDVLNR